MGIMTNFSNDNNMVIEAERRFIVNACMLPELSKLPRKHIIQGYTRDGERVRLIVRDVSLGIALDNILMASHCIKVETGRFGVREETEVALTSSTALALFNSVVEYKLIKTRFNFPFEGNVWEIDVYAGDHAPLVVAECEVPEEGLFGIKVPDFCMTEVTGEPEFSNFALACFGLPFPNDGVSGG